MVAFRCDATQCGAFRRLSDVSHGLVLNGWAARHSNQRDCNYRFCIYQQPVEWSEWPWNELLGLHSHKQSLFRPGQAMRLPGGWGSQFHDNRHMKVVRLLAPRTGRLYPPGKITGTGLCSRLSRPQGHSADYVPLAPSGIEPATFRFVASCLKELRHRIPHNPTRVRELFLPIMFWPHHDFCQWAPWDREYLLEGEGDQTVSQTNQHQLIVHGSLSAFLLYMLMALYLRRWVLTLPCY
jgi:hypothetical protein